MISFISLGPGDPDLLTLKSLIRLKESDIILVPATLKGDKKPMSRAADIIGFWKLSTEVRLFPIPMQHSPQQALTAYDAMCEEIKRLHEEGRRVAVGVEGDISIYASIHYVMQRLQAEGIAVEQLPGIPSFIAAAAVANLSLVSRDERLLVVPGNVTAPELERLLSNRHTVVIMKLSQCEHEVKAFIRSHPTHAYHYFENVGTATQFHTTDTALILQRPLPYFSLMVIK